MPDRTRAHPSGRSFLILNAADSMYYPCFLESRLSIENKGGHPMFRKLISTTDDLAITVLRLILGVVFFAHGAQKTLGWFGGYGFSGTMGFFTQQAHIPAALAFLAICAEFLGGIGFLPRLLRRLAALCLALNMVVAITMG